MNNWQEESFFEAYIAPTIVMLTYGGMIFLFTYYIGLELFSD